MEYIDLAGIGALILAVAALYKAWKGEPRDTADAAKIWQEMSATSAIQQKECKERMDAIETHLVELQEELVEYKIGVDKLIAQLETHKIRPVWRPRRRDG